MRPFEKVVGEVRGREPHKYTHWKDKLIEDGIDDAEALPSLSQPRDARDARPSVTALPEMMLERRTLKVVIMQRVVGIGPFPIQWLSQS